jgi:hypothetical protein
MIKWLLANGADTTVKLWGEDAKYWAKNKNIDITEIPELQS